MPAPNHHRGHMTPRALLFAVALSALIPFQVSAQAVLGSNLIVNGRAEAGSGGDGFVVLAAPGFVSSGNFTVVQYAAGGGFPGVTDPGPVDRGSNFFAGGPNNAASSASQLIDLSALVGQIDSGGVSFELSAFLGGFGSQPDHAALTASFLDGASGLLGSFSLSSVANTDRDNQTGLLFRFTSGAVPIGSRSVDIRLDMTRFAGSYNDGYADNLSLVLTAVPEAPTALMLGLGLLGLGLRTARSRRC